jgi:hypothetical protein
MGHEPGGRLRNGNAEAWPPPHVSLGAVHGGEHEVRRLGVSGVPFFVTNEKVALPGAQPPELFRRAFEQAERGTERPVACDFDPTTGEGAC